MPRNAPNVYNLPERHDPSRRNVVLRRIVRVHEPAVRRFLRARLANHPDHEDLVQEIYLRLLRQEDLEEKLSMGEAQTRSYLFSMANNLIRDRFRREKVRSELSLNLIAEQTPDNRGPFSGRHPGVAPDYRCDQEDHPHVAGFDPARFPAKPFPGIELPRNRGRHEHIDQHGGETHHACACGHSLLYPCRTGYRPMRAR